jgi:Permeases
MNRSTEIIAGISSFLATSYIIVVNPSILQQAGMPFSGVLTATVIVCFFSSLMMGLYARNPILVAPGMGLNAFFYFFGRYRYAGALAGGAGCGFLERHPFPATLRI